MYKNTKNVSQYIFGKGSIVQLKELLNDYQKEGSVVYLIDHFFKNKTLVEKLPISKYDQIHFIDTTDEPDTDQIDILCQAIKEKSKLTPNCIIGIGGGSTLDTAKAASNLLTNSGKAEDYQGWDLVKKAGVYKIGIPTLSGTGAESSRTCIMTNKKKGIKLGMNSDFTVFDQLILDPDLSRTVSRDQYFYTGMDTYLHCMESLNGSYRNVIVDALSEKALQLCKEVFLSEDMQDNKNCEKMMIASYFGGCAAGNVGAVHPLSAGLSTALKIHHGLANCMVMNVMDEFYPKEFEEFSLMLEKQQIKLPDIHSQSSSQKLSHNSFESVFEEIYNSSIIHEKPLTNALGKNFKETLTKEKMLKIFKRM